MKLVQILAIPTFMCVMLTYFVVLYALDKLDEIIKILKGTDNNNNKSGD